MKYDLKEHGLIDEDGKVTLVGRIMLESALQTKEFLEGEREELTNEFTPEYSSCWNKDSDEIIKWEEENKAVCIYGSNEGLIELVPSRFFNRDKDGNKIYTPGEHLFISMVEDNSNSEAYIIIENRKEMIKMRDYLTRFIEKEEYWSNML